MEAIEIYKSLSQPPKSALRQIQAGDLKGKTDINPQWRYEAMTEKFGLVGLGWKYEIQKLWTEPGANGEMLAFAQVAVFIRDPATKEWSDPIVGIGGSKLINKFSAGPKSNDEGYKMAVTDAFSTSLKMIGVAADIYAGRWDGSKYSETPQNNLKAQDTSEEKQKLINTLLATKKADGSFVFTPEEKKNFASWQKSHTQTESIAFLEQKIEERKGDAFPEDIPYDEKPLNEAEAAGADAAFDVKQIAG